MQDDIRSDVLHAFKRYTEAFQALDAGAIARQFHEPALFITPREIVALTTAAEVKAAFTRVIGDLPADYARTEFSDLSAHRLGEDLAMVSGRGTWKNAANDDIMPFGMTYTLRCSEGIWRIAVAATHAPDGGPGR